MSSRPAAGGGRWVEVPPERLERWFAGFAERHGVDRTESAGSLVTIVGADGALAECHPPFPPVPDLGDGVKALIAHAQTDRRVGVLLVRLGGYAVGVFAGRELLVSKVDTRLVHGRNKAGGQSAQRFVRRREGQARQLAQAAAATAARVLLPELKTLDAVVFGGDRAAIDATLAEDRKLAPLADLAVALFLTVPDPRRAVLDATPDAYRATHIRILD